MRIAHPVAGLLAAAVLTVNGCASSRPPDEAVVARYRAALAAAERGRLGAGPTTAAQAQAALDRFVASFATYSADEMQRHAPAIYAEGAYFNDTVKELQGRDQIVAYLVRSAQMLVDPKVEIADTVLHDGHAYVRWVMTFTTVKAKGRPATVARGVTHLVFDAQGKVAFQQDYWDTAGAIYEKVPVLGGMIRRVKARL